MTLYRCLITVPTLTFSLALGCSSSSSTAAAGKGDAGTGEGGNADEVACAASASAECSLEAKCEPNTLSASYGTSSNCETRVELSCKASLAAKGTSRTTAQDEACAAAYPDEACDALLNGLEPTACNPVKGAGAAGSACSFSAQCASAFCGIPVASGCGTCQDVPAAGDSCTDLTNCGPTLSCYKGTCVAYAANDAACSPTSPCGAGLACVTKLAHDAGVCHAQGTTVGAACDSKNVSAADCDITLGLYCVAAKAGPNADTCQKVAIAKPGAACGYVNDVTTICSDVSSCIISDPGTPGQTGTCVARAADGASCDTVSGPACQSPARCVGTMLDGGTSGKCTLPGTTTCP